MQRLGIALIYLGLLFFPLSVAASNAALGLALLCSLFCTIRRGGDMWLGMQQLWQTQRSLYLVLLIYIAWFLLAICWSSDIERGLKLAARFWVWLLLPVLLLWLADTIRQRRALMAFSLGMTIHLLLTITQKLGFIEILQTAGSTPEDATGLVGHIGFGFIYGLWAAALAFWGWQHYHISKVQAGLAIIIALLSWWLIFAADGRSGYLITITAILLLLWKIYWLHISQRTRVLSVVILLLLLFSVLAVNWHNERVQFTINSVQTVIGNTLDGEDLSTLQNAESRLSMWFAAWQVFMQQPLVGAGTGAFNVESGILKQQYPALNFDAQSHASHPHQMYLQAMSERGLIGLFTLLALLFVWWRTAKTETDWLTWYLCIAPVTAIIIHGLSAPAIDEHFSLLLAVIALATSLARQKNSKETIED